MVPYTFKFFNGSEMATQILNRVIYSYVTSHSATQKLEQIFFSQNFPFKSSFQTKAVSDTFSFHFNSKFSFTRSSLLHFHFYVKLSLTLHLPWPRSHQ